METVSSVISSIKSFLTSKYLALTGGTMNGCIERSGTSVQWRSILNSSNKNDCGLYQSSYSGYMPMLNMMTTDGRCGIGTYQNYLALTYFLNTNETNSADCSVYINTNGMTIKGKNVVCVETWRNGTSWYRKYADGWIEQGGRIGAYSGTITFPVSFSNTNYTFLSMPIGRVSNSFYVIETTSMTTTSINVTWDGEVSKASGIMCYACGY